jgi:hypothetical protein
VVRALKSAWAEEAASLLDLLYGLGLTAELVTALAAIEANIPALSDEVQRRTLDALALALQGRAYRHPGLSNVKSAVRRAPDKPWRSGSGLAPDKSSRAGPRAAAVATPEDEIAVKVLSLKTLRMFNLSRHSLTKFCKQGIAPLMTHESPEIRESACITVAAILVPRPPTPGSGIKPQPVDVREISEVLLQLLAAGIIDRKSKIRRAVIVSLEGPLEPYLAKVEALKSLFVFM